MSEPAFRGTCEDCGKVYRVPSDDRTWNCKACGGTVSVATKGAKAAGRPARARSRTHEDDDEEEEEEEQHPRHAHKREYNLYNWVMLVGVLAVLGGGGWIFVFSGDVQAKGERDLSKVILTFDDAWKAGNLDGLMGMVHPQKAAEFRPRFEAMRTNRGWTDGFPGVTASVVPDPSELGAEFQQQGEVMKSKSHHQLAIGRVACSWQYNPSNETWYIYYLEVPLPDILPRLDAFEPVWTQSDSAALAPFFRPGQATKMGDVLDRGANSSKRDWGGVFPALSNRSIDPDPATLNEPSFFSKKKVEVTYTTAKGPLMIRWRMHDQSDNWCISGFDLPE